MKSNRHHRKRPTAYGGGFSSADAAPPAAAKAFVIDDESIVRQGICALLQDAGYAFESFSTCEEFLATYKPGVESCLILDLHLPGMGGIELLRRMQIISMEVPVIMVSGSSAIPEAVQALKDGAFDFIEKPILAGNLLAVVRRGFDQWRKLSETKALRARAVTYIADLTPRQREIMDRVLAGQPSKNIAADLGISQRTVENHRAAIMRKTGSNSLADLARLAIRSEGGGE